MRAFVDRSILSSGFFHAVTIFEIKRKDTNDRYNKYRKFRIGISAMQIMTKF